MVAETPPLEGPPRPALPLPQQPGQPDNSSGYSWGVVLLFNIEEDPLEEHDLAGSNPDLVKELTQALDLYAAQQISQDVEKTGPCSLIPPPTHTHSHHHHHYHHLAACWV